MRGWMTGVIGAALLVIAAGVAVVAIVASSDDGTSVVDLDVGDCFDLPEGSEAADELTSVLVVDCSEPHLAEVVSDGTLATDDAPYPDDDELFDLVERRCRDAAVVESADFGLLPVAPTPELWASFDGRFLCVAIPFGGAPVTGSLVAG